MFWQPNDDAPGLAVDWNPNFNATPGFQVLRRTLVSLGNSAPASAGETIANANASLQPSFGEQAWGGQYNWPAFTFNGAGYYMACGAASVVGIPAGINTPWSALLVVKNVAVSGVQTLMAWCSTLGFNPLFDVFSNSTPNWVAQKRGDAGGAPAVAVGGTPDTAKTVILVLYSGTTVTVRVNGVAVINGAALATGVLTPNVLAIGASFVSGLPNNFANAMVARICLWPRLLSGGEATTLESNATKIYLL